MGQIDVKIYTIIFLLLAITSCGSPNAPEKPTQRQLLMSELYRLNEVIEMDKKEEFASFFDFPIKNAALWQHTSMYDSLISDNVNFDSLEMTSSVLVKEAHQIYLGHLGDVLAPYSIDSLAFKNNVTKKILRHNLNYSYELYLNIDVDSERLVRLKISSSFVCRLWEDSKKVEQTETWYFKLNKDGKLKFQSVKGIDTSTSLMFSCH